MDIQMASPVELHTVTVKRFDFLVNGVTGENFILEIVEKEVIEFIITEKNLSDVELSP